VAAAFEGPILYPIALCLALGGARKGQFQCPVEAWLERGGVKKGRFLQPIPILRAEW
jgi:hypothetical protein